MALPLTIVGAPSAASDAAVARWLEAFLRAERPGTTWTAQAPAQARREAA